ncbi:MAG TPA: hypothetical protein VFP64_16245, partial [Pyrinomonadaceae bacterium]|nr:hypothetical protein [Pyrinomonadaceae bacterium]
MKRKRVALSLIGAGLLGLGLVGLRSMFESQVDPVVKASKTDQRILQAMRVIEKMPNSADGYNQLASAYMQKARETADFDLNANAEDAIARSLSVEPDNYDALKLRAKVQLTYHRFNEALETARRAQTVRTDDHDVWGQITDALVELGDYAGAVNAAQKMV